MKHNLLVLFLILTFTSCSGTKSSQDVAANDAGLELSEAENLLSDDDFEEGKEEPVAQTEEVKTEEVVVTEEQPTEPLTDPALQPEEPVMNTEMVTETKPVINDVGSMKSYTVGKNETLMLVAFKVYGDYLKWKDLLNDNSAVLKGNPANLRPGMVLSHYGNGEEMVWNPGGNPYLIKNGDTLGLISKEVYGTLKKWKDIWMHNKPLIKDPNKIYVGFTIYYLDGARDVASP
ncbi:MAG: LysM peptidoglycan-binding domain-containing protein [Bacteriovoracaceae bacterium]|nr:LysM peptidoglycan-binding domain-containing protein [Bacteriovoracaceae bacterium]